MSKIKSLLLLVAILLSFQSLYSQKLNLKPRRADAMGGRTFALSISDDNLTLKQREELIFKEIKSGNVPNFLRRFKKVSDTSTLSNEIFASVDFYVLPDYFAIGSDIDFFYIPMTPILAQRVANLLKCTLPTKKMVDVIYKNAVIKIQPKPIPPSKAMTAVPAFIAHQDSINSQLRLYTAPHLNGEITAGNKKDIIISNKIYTEKAPKVVIYGWHQLNGKAIQPVYNKHSNTWADYSHGVRFVLQKAVQHRANQSKTTTIARILGSPASRLLSDEGSIEKPYYPNSSY